MIEKTINFWGLTGDPVHDTKRKAEIARELGQDNFDYDQYEQMERDDDYWDHINQEVRNINSR